jgi:hypothetical protein
VQDYDNLDGEGIVDGSLWVYSRPSLVGSSAVEKPASIGEEHTGRLE